MEVSKPRKNSNFSIIPQLNALKAKIYLNYLEFSSNDLFLINDLLDRYLNLEEKYNKIIHYDEQSVSSSKCEVLINSHGKIIEANNYFADKLGIERSKLINKQLIEFICNDNVDEFLIHIGEVFKSRKQVTKNIMIQKQDKTRLLMKMTIKPLYREEKDLPSFRLEFEDISVKEHINYTLNDSQKGYRVLNLKNNRRNMSRNYLDASRELAVVIDTNQRVSLINTSGCQSIGLLENEILGKKWVDNFIPNKMKRKTEILFTNVLSGAIEPNSSFEIPLITKTGGESIISWKCTVILDYSGLKLGILLLGKDITKERLVESTLKQRTHELGERVKELSCLYKLSKLLINPKITEDEVFTQTIELIPSAWQYPEITCCRILYKQKEFKTQNFASTKWQQSANIVMSGQKIGSVEVCYLEQRPDEDEGLFLREERDLINTIARELGNYINRKKSENKLNELLIKSIQHQEEVISLLEASRSILKYRKFDDSISSILKSCKNLVGASLGFITLIDDQNEEEAIIIDSNSKRFNKTIIFSHEIHTIQKLVITSKSASYSNVVFGSILYTQERILTIDNVLITPLTLDDKIIGYITLANKINGFDGADVTITSGFTEFVTLALLNSRMLMSLKSSEEYFRSITNLINDAVISINEKGIIKSINHKTEQMFGYNETELIGKSVSILMPENFRQRHQKAVEIYNPRKISNISKDDEDIFGLTRKGEKFPIEVNITNRVTQDGLIITGVIKDISKRKRAENALRNTEENYKLLVENSEVGILTVNGNNGELGFISEKLKKMLNFSSFHKDLINLSDFVLEDDLSETKKLISKVFRSNEGYSFSHDCEFRLKYSDGKEIWLRMKATRMYNSDLVQCYLWDVSQEKEFLKFQDRFIMMTSHELRTPLTVISFYLDWIRKQSLTISSQEKELHQTAIRNVQRLEKLINGVCDLEAIRRNMFKISPDYISINKYIKTINTELKLLYESRMIIINVQSFEHGIDLMYFDQDRLTQVILNLVSNAVKNSSPDSIIDITFYIEREELRISVRDFGIGMSPNVLFQIFQPFYHKPSKYSSFGVGLGLYLVKSIILAHNGKIEVTSNIGEGSMFAVTISCANDNIFNNNSQKNDILRLNEIEG